MKQVAAPIADGVTAFTLAACQFLRMSKVQGCRIVCTSGILLVTVSGEYGDFDLYPGDTLAVPNNGLALIEAIGVSSLLLQEPRRNVIQRAFLSLAQRGERMQQKSGMGV
jgi:hypothetical protein